MPVIIVLQLYCFGAGNLQIFYLQNFFICVEAFEVLSNILL